MMQSIEKDNGSRALLPPVAPLRVVNPVASTPAPAHGDAFSLDWLLAPVGTDVFFDEYWEKRPLLIKRNDPSYFANLPGIDDIDELMSATASHAARRADDLRIVRTEAGCVLEERPIKLDSNGYPDIQDAYRAYSEGYTFVLNRIHDRSASVAHFCDALERALHQPIGVNMYATPGNGQGFLQHDDDHDVFIVQVHGTKEWHIASPTKELPLAVTNMRLVKRGPVIPDLGSFTLEQGDVLYIPRGFLHEATTTNSSSAHLTIGIHAFKWLDLVIEAVKALAEDNRFLRQALPPGYLDMPLALNADIGDQIAAILREQSVIESAKSRLERKLFSYRKVVQRGHLRSLDVNARLDLDSVVYPVPGRMSRVRVDSSEVIIEFSGNFVAGPLALKPMFDFVARGRRFSVSELPGDFSSADKLDLTRRLVSEGLVRIEDS